MKIFPTHLLLAIVFLFSSSFVEAANKALVIGNNDYSGKLSRLSNPIRDAELVENALRNIGFEVSLKKNLDYQSFDEEMKSFANSLTSSDIAFIYYAGHGLAWEENDYLLPISPSIEHETSVKYHAINAQEMLDIISSSSQHTIFVIDACRDNPFSRSTGVRGLGYIKSGRGSSYILYSASLGEVASDDGTFARVLAEELRRPQSLDDIRAQLRNTIQQHSNYKQNPNSVNALSVGTLYFLKPTAQSAPIQVAENRVNVENLFQQGQASYDRQDYDQARQLWEQAAKHGYASAQYNLGALYDHGEGVKQDYSQAKYWYEKAAAQGNSYAQMSLGDLYLHGHGVKKRYQQAKYWFEKAAIQDNAYAQDALNLLKQQGY